ITRFEAHTRRSKTMDIGAAIFFTDYSITPTELAIALEERGFDSLWVAEHSHIPVTRRFNVGGAFAARRAIRYGDGLIPQAPSTGSGSPEEFMPRLHQMAEEA